MNTEHDKQQREVSLLPSTFLQQEIGNETMLQHPNAQIMEVTILTAEDLLYQVKWADIGTILEKMKEGVIINLHISRPRFWHRLTLDDLGLMVQGQRVTSTQANEIMTAYFQLGRSILPKVYQDRLANAESSARACLANYSFKSHWGSFVPRTQYQQWKDNNNRLETEFWVVRDDILAHYDRIVDQVMEDHWSLAEDMWQRITLGAALLEQDTSLTPALLREITDHLRAGHGKNTFVTNYLECIRAAMPKKDVIEQGFEYRIERGMVPLISLVAPAVEQADRIYHERTLQDEETQRELEAIETQYLIGIPKLTLQQQREREELYQKLQKRQERQRRQLEMERDILDDTRQQKESQALEFYISIVQQITTLIFQATQSVFDSLEKNKGVIRGPTSVQLRNLVSQLENRNFVNNRLIDSQLERLRAVLPTEDEQKKAAKGLMKINTTNIDHVVRIIHQEAKNLLVDLEAQPRNAAGKVSKLYNKSK